MKKKIILFLLRLIMQVKINLLYIQKIKVNQVFIVEII